MFPQTYNTVEMIWGVIVIIGIFAVNGCILWVLTKSRQLWKPRHLWMACLCITDMFVGGHKCLELLIMVWPKREVCVLQRATLGIPFVVNMLLLTLLSLDRFIAVRYPFYYSKFVSNRHVLIGFLFVLLIGSVLAGVSIALGMRDPVCRAHKIQLVYLTVFLTITSVLTLFFNSSVLKIAKRQLSAIYSREPVMNPRRISLFCHNCSQKNATTVNSFSPPLADGVFVTSGVSEMSTARTSLIPISIPVGTSATSAPCLNHSIILSAADLQSRCQQALSDDSRSTHETTPLTLLEQTVEDGMSPMVRTLSLPTLNEALSVIVPSDPIVPVATVSLNRSTMNLLESTINEVQIQSTSPLDPAVTCPPTITVALPRSRSFTCATKSPPEVTVPKSHPIFRNLHVTGPQILQMGKLFPSIRFARTVLLIMIPMWVFILPVIIIIPLHRGCVDNGDSEYDCHVIDKLWDYLMIHVRSILPLQAIVDPLIYAFGSKEFRHCFMKTFRGRKMSIDI